MFSHSSGSCPYCTYHQHNQDLFSWTKQSSKALKKTKMTPNPYEFQSTYKFSALTVSTNTRLPQTWTEKHTGDDDRWENLCWDRAEVGFPLRNREMGSWKATKEQQHLHCSPGTAAQQNQGLDSGKFLPDCTQSVSKSDSTASSLWGQVWVESRAPGTTELLLLHSGHGSYTSSSAAKAGWEVEPWQWVPDPSAPPTTHSAVATGQSPESLHLPTSSPSPWHHLQPCLRLKKRLLTFFLAQATSTII